ncbi:hypothetical protein K439DRAFT_1647251 [Ramaria rubella]|nr:hypothetical protein K439DRAFT_1647251 [Ramaria rubella]
MWEHNQEQIFENEGPEQSDYAPSENRLETPDIIPALLHLIQSWNFIKALENASLDNGNLSDEQLKNPPQEVFCVNDPNELYSLKQYLAVQNASQGNHNSCYPKDPMLLHSQIKSKVAQWSGVEPMVHNMCPNSCMSYTGPFKDLESFSKGQTKVAAQKFYTLPLGPQLQALWHNPKIAGHMRHHQQKTAEILHKWAENDDVVDAYNNIYHGYDYLNTCKNGNISNDNMLVMLSVDGVQLYCDKKSDCWIYIFINLQLPPQLCYEKKYVIPGGVVPGPKPKDMESFLFPGFHHISALQKEGLTIWDSGKYVLFTLKIFYFLTMADGSGSIYITCLVGHTGACPCRLFCGIKGHCKPRKSCYYPIYLRPHNYNVPGSDHPDVNIQDLCEGSTEEYDCKLKHLLRSHSYAKYERHRKHMGISKQSLHRLPMASTFVGDSMHMMMLNLGDLFPPLWRGQFECDPTDSMATWPWAVLTGDVWKKHGEDVANAHPFMPGSFDWPPCNLTEKIHSGYKAKEWQGYFYGLALPNMYWKNFCKLVRAVRILLDKFHMEYETIYVQRRTDCIHFFCPCVHALLHLGLEVPHLGLPTMTSQWTMEHTLSNLGEEIHQPLNPYANISECRLQQVQLNALKAMIPSLDKDSESVPQGSLNIGDDRYPHHCEGIAGQVVNLYICMAEEELGNELPDTWTVKIVRWARVLLPNGQIVYMLLMHCMATSDTLYLSIDDQVEYAKVQFYFTIKIGDEL